MELRPHTLFGNPLPSLISESNNKVGKFTKQHLSSQLRALLHLHLKKLCSLMLKVLSTFPILKEGEKRKKCVSYKKILMLKLTKKL